MTKNNKFFNALKKSLEEVRAHKQGKLDLRSYEIEVPQQKADQNDDQHQKQPTEKDPSGS